jgi:hypothetical protein
MSRWVSGLGLLIASAMGFAAPASALTLDSLDFANALAFSTEAIPCTGGLTCTGGIASNGNGDGPGLWPEGLAYRSETNTLLLSAGTGSSAMWLYELNLDGTFTDPANPALFQFPAGSWRGLDYINGRDTVLASQEFGQIREFNLDGTLATGGISFDIVGADDAEGVVIGPDGAVYIADDGNETIRRFTGSGSTWTEDTGGAFPISTRSLNTTNFDDPSGIEVIRYADGTFSLLVHDDSSGAFGGVWEVVWNDVSASLLDTVVNSLDLTNAIPGCSPGGCNDGEALAYFGGTTEGGGPKFFVAYEGDQRVISFPVEEDVAPEPVPEPGTGLLMLLALSALARRVRV